MHHFAQDSWQRFNHQNWKTKKAQAENVNTYIHMLTIVHHQLV